MIEVLRYTFAPDFLKAGKDGIFQHIDSSAELLPYDYLKLRIQFTFPLLVFITNKQMGVKPPANGLFKPTHFSENPDGCGMSDKLLYPLEAPLYYRPSVPAESSWTFCPRVIQRRSSLLSTTATRRPGNLKANQ